MKKELTELAMSTAERGIPVGNGTTTVGLLVAIWNWMGHGANGMAIGALVAVLGLVITAGSAWLKRRDEKRAVDHAIAMAELRERRDAKEYRLRMRKEYGSKWDELTQAPADNEAYAHEHAGGGR